MPLSSYSPSPVYSPFASYPPVHSVETFVSVSSPAGSNVTCFAVSVTLSRCRMPSFPSSRGMIACALAILSSMYSFLPRLTVTLS